MEIDELDRQVAEMATIVSGAPERWISDGDVLRWSGSVDNLAFYNAASLRIAQKYNAGEMNYLICDEIMNDLWRILISSFNGGLLPSPFYEIYEAFDAGEYHRRSDRSDNPAANYTEPMIQAILLKFAISE